MISHANQVVLVYLVVWVMLQIRSHVKIFYWKLDKDIEFISMKSRILKSFQMNDQNVGQGPVGMKKTNKIVSPRYW